MGDVYYSGTEWEARERFLKHWPGKSKANQRSWCLNGNHDMYSGGYGYFEVILGDPRFYAQHSEGEPMSSFALANRHWQVIGLDSAFHTRSRLAAGHLGYLTPGQGEWLKSRAGQSSKSMMLSHHPAFDGLGRQKGNLLGVVKGAMGRGAPDAWFWAHDHRCLTYPPGLGTPYAACVGHGAMPEEVGVREAGPDEFEHIEPTEPDADDDVWRKCGFAVLDFNGEACSTRYVNELGKTLHTEEVR
jgi:hypothetical protein